MGGSLRAAATPGRDVAASSAPVLPTAVPQHSRVACGTSSETQYSGTTSTRSAAMMPGTRAAHKAKE
eukprot:366228-Chlamydomonas_euryale.AAC.2